MNSISIGLGLAWMSDFFYHSTITTRIAMTISTYKRTNLKLISHTNIPQKIAFSESTVGGKILRARIF